MLRKVINFERGLKRTCGARARSIVAGEVIRTRRRRSAGAVRGEWCRGGRDLGHRMKTEGSAVKSAAVNRGAGFAGMGRGSSQGGQRSVGGGEYTRTC